MFVLEILAMDVVVCGCYPVFLRALYTSVAQRCCDHFADRNVTCHAQSKDGTETRSRSFDPKSFQLDHPAEIVLGPRKDTDSLPHT